MHGLTLHLQDPAPTVTAETKSASAPPSPTFESDALSPASLTIDQRLNFYRTILDPVRTLLDRTDVREAEWLAALKDFTPWAESIIPLMDSMDSDLLTGPSLLITSYMLGYQGQLLLQCNNFSEAYRWLTMALDVAERRARVPLVRMATSAEQREPDHHDHDEAEMRRWIEAMRRFKFGVELLNKPGYAAALRESGVKLDDIGDGTVRYERALSDERTMELLELAKARGSEPENVEQTPEPTDVKKKSRKKNKKKSKKGGKANIDSSKSTTTVNETSESISDSKPKIEKGKGASEDVPGSPAVTSAPKMTVVGQKGDDAAIEPAVESTVIGHQATDKSKVETQKTPPVLVAAPPLSTAVEQAKDEKAGKVAVEAVGHVDTGRQSQVVQVEEGMEALALGTTQATVSAEEGEDPDSGRMLRRTA